MAVSDSILRHGSIVFSEKGAAELDGRQSVVFVPRQEIRSVDLKFAVGSDRPVFTLLFGLGLVLGATLLPLMLLITGAYGARALYLMPFAVPGAWIIRLSTRKRWVVELGTTRGRRRLILGSSVDQAEVDQFLAAVRRTFGYTAGDV